MEVYELIKAIISISYNEKMDLREIIHNFDNIIKTRFPNTTQRDADIAYVCICERDNFDYVDGLKG